MLAKLAIVVLTLEFVYRMVALPLDYHERLVESERLKIIDVAVAGTEALTVSALTTARQRGTSALPPTGLRLQVYAVASPALSTMPTRVTDYASQSPAKVTAEVHRLPPLSRSNQHFDGRPLVGIIIDDMGYSPASLRRLIDMPGPLTLSFLPDADSTPSMLAKAEEHDFEILLHLPMEPMGDAIPGREALLVGLDEDELRRRVRRAVDLVPGAVGVNNHMGSRFTAMARDLDIVMDELRRHWLFFIDSRTNPLSIAESVALAHDIPASGRNVFIDHDPSTAAIVRQLAIIERVASHGGNVLAIGHPYPTTLAALAAWLPTLEPRGFRLVRSSEVVAARLCSEPGKPRPPGGERACSPTVRLIGNDAAPLPQPLVDAVP